MKARFRLSALAASSVLLSVLTISCSQALNSNEASIVVLSTGIQVVDSDTNEAMAFSFGEADEVVNSAIAANLGDSVGTVIEKACGLTLTDWPNALGTVTKDNQFVGWTVEKDDRGKSPFKTPEGLSIGSKLSELEAVSTTNVRKEGDHAEFETADGYMGGLNGNVPQAKVYVLSAGELCEDSSYAWPRTYGDSIE